MPYSKKKRSYGKKKSVSKKRTNRKKKAVKKRIAKRKSVHPSKASSMVYYSSPPRATGIKRTQRVKVPFCWSSNGATLDTTNQGSLGNNYYLQQFRLNSLFDPDFTGVGHQPRYTDEWALWYQRARVNGCKVELDFHEATSNTIGIYIWVSPATATYPSSNGAPVNTPTEVFQNCGGAVISSVSTSSYNKLQELHYVKAMRYNASGDANVLTWSNYYSVNKEFNLKNIDKSALDQLFATANPSAELYLNVMVAKDDNVAFTNGFGINARLTYYATLSDPANITTSS